MFDYWTLVSENLNSVFRFRISFFQIGFRKFICGFRKCCMSISGSSFESRFLVLENFVFPFRVSFLEHRISILENWFWFFLVSEVFAFPFRIRILKIDFRFLVSENFVFRFYKIAFRKFIFGFWFWKILYFRFGFRFFFLESLFSVFVS